MMRQSQFAINPRKIYSLACSVAISQWICFGAQPSAHSQTIELPAGKSEYRYNQSLGTSNSVAVGITSSFGVYSSAQASPSYNAAASASMVLNTDPASGSASPVNYNSSTQSVGTEASNSPVNVKITSNTIQAKSTDGSTIQDTIGSKQIKEATNFSDSGNSSSNAEFSAQGFGAVQDLRFRGTTSDPAAAPGSSLTADVLPLLKIDEQGNTSSGSSYGTGSANSNAETKTRFQADITTSTFANAFVSSF